MKVDYIQIIEILTYQLLEVMSAADLAAVDNAVQNVLSSTTDVILHYT